MHSERNMRKSILAAGMTRPYRAGVSPSRDAISAALAQCDGNAYAAGRLLGCSKTPVRNFIDAERAKGKIVGHYRRNERRPPRALR